MKKLLKIFLIVVGVALALVIGVLALIYIPSPKFEPLVYDPVEPEYWPTEGWRSSTPEEQGMDSETLAEMISFVERERSADPLFRIDSITIIRNGYLVADIYPNPLSPQSAPHILHSCTKSILSMLVGIAIDEGYLAGVDVPVIDLFADLGYQMADERMSEVTVGHLLAMSTGIRAQDDRPYQYRGLFEIQASDDWIETFFNLPIDVEPGTRFDYSNIASFMIGAVVQEATGMDLLAFARQHLFDPLGIEEVLWEQNPQGYYISWARMWLAPHDMAKIGLLLLQQGRWAGQQIIPAEWVSESVTPHAYPRNYVDVLDAAGNKDADASAANWRAHKFVKPFNHGYGYQIWLDRSGAYAAVGTSGQYIVVDPSQNLVVAFTSKLTGLDTFAPIRMVEKFILRSIESDGPIPPNPTAYDELVRGSSPPARSVERQPVPVLPEVATEISGVTYQMEPNDWRHNDFELVFGPSRDHAEFSYSAKGGQEVINMVVGLDNVPRFAETNGHTYAAVGYWSAADTFTVDYEVIGYSTQDRWNLTFTPSGLLVEEINELTGIKTYSGVPE